MSDAIPPPIVRVHDEFGPFCADGERAARFRFEKIDPLIPTAERIIFDFAGVRGASSTFCTALIANIVSQNSPDVIRKLKFVNCVPTIRLLVEAAIETGLVRLEESAQST